MELLFGAPALLYGLTAASVPIVIHLLLRQRPRLAEFPALRFLRAGFRLHRARLRLRHLLLLLLRVLTVVLLVLALSQPMLRSRWFSPAGHRTAQVILIVDDSYSMGYREDGATRLDAAKKEAHRLLSTLALGSPAALLTTSRPVGDFTIDLTALARRVSDLELTPDDTPVWAALEATRDLPRPQADEPVELYVVTDMTRQAWRQTPGLQLELPPDTTLTVIDVGVAQVHNASVTAIDPPGTTTAQNRTVEFTTTVRAQGATGPRTLAFYLDGARRADRPLDLKGDQLVTEKFRHTFRAPGVHQGWVDVVEADNLLADNRRYFAVVVGAQPSLLMVDGEPGPGSEDELFFAHLALSPGGFGRASPFRLERVSPDELTELRRLEESFQVVLLANVPSLPADTWAELGRFVLGGGGLALFLGDQVDPENYNTYARDLLPGDVGPAESFPDRARLIVPSFGHPLVASFADGRNGDLSAPRFTWARRLGLSESPEVELVAIFQSGVAGMAPLPACAVRRFGRGLAACFTSSLDSEWTDFPRWPAYLPFLHELTKFLSRMQAAEHDFHVGEVARVQLHALLAGGERKLSLVRPGEAGALPLAALATERTLVFTDTGRTGGYTIVMETPDIPAGPVNGFSVNLNPAEGDLSRVSPEEVGALLPKVPVVRSIAELPAVWAQAGRGGTRELSPWLLVAALVVFLSETWLANRFYPS